MDGPPRCTAAEIAAVLAATAQPESALLIDDVIDPFPSPVSFITPRQWLVTLWSEPSGAGWVMAARAPDGRTWQHGCQRQWTTTGEVIEPMDALSAEQRVTLRRRLERAQRWPLPDAPEAPAVVMRDEQIAPKRRVRGGKR